jgi:hypothetical protein
MTKLMERVEAEAMALSARQRSFLAERLLESLSGESDAATQRLWIQAAEKGYQQMAAGSVKGRKADAVFKAARKAVR